MDTKKQNILIIENDPKLDQVLISSLRKYHWLHFASGRKGAFEIVDHNPIDLIVLDLDTPEVSAGEIFSRLSANPANCNTEILLMVNKEQECKLGELPPGVADCISKPIQAPIIKARVQSYLELKGYRDLWEGAAKGSRRIEAGSPWGFDGLLDREWRRALRNQTPISLILIDIEDFKDMDPSTADNCIQMVGEMLRECIKRDLDIIAYDNTHAFMCLLPDTDADGTRRICQKVEESMAKLSTSALVSSQQVSLCIGTATARPTFKLDPGYLLCQAEKMMGETGNGNTAEEKTAEIKESMHSNKQKWLQIGPLAKRIETNAIRNSE